MGGSTNAALYARVSSQRQAEGMTIKSQVAALRQRISRDGLAAPEELCVLDDGCSGGTLQRPGLERLRDLIHCGGVDCLYVHSPDRLARNYVHQMVLLEEFSRQGVKVIFLNDDPQHQSAEGNLLRQMQGMIAEYERAKILERTRRGRRYAARQGKVSVLGHAPYGYRYVTKQQGNGEARYEVVLEEAQHVRDIFTWVALEGLSLSRVAKRLTERGVLTRTGKTRWDTATIRGILLNPACTGAAKYGKTRQIPRAPGRRPKRGDPAIPRQATVTQATPPEEQDTIVVPPLIGPTLFTAATERLAENRLRYREQKNGAEFLLGGLLVCSRCGSAYCGRRSKTPNRQDRYVYYRCLGTDKYRHGGEAICANKSVRGLELEAAVWSDVCSLLQDPGRLRRELERRLQHSPPEDLEIASRERSITHLKRRLARLVDAYEQGWLEKADLASRIAHVKERLQREQALQAQREQELVSDAELRVIEGQFNVFATQITAGLADADFALRRRLLQLLVRRIEIDEADVRIVYKVQAPPLPFAQSPDRGFLQHCLRRRHSAQGCRASRLPWVSGRNRNFTPTGLRHLVLPIAH